MTDEVVLGLCALLDQAAESLRGGDQAKSALIKGEILKQFRGPLRLWIRQAISQATRQTLAHSEISDRICQSMIGDLVASLPESAGHADLALHLRKSLWRTLADAGDPSHASTIASSPMDSPKVSPDGCSEHNNKSVDCRVRVK